jgi:hypothetical protein
MRIKPALEKSIRASVGRMNGKENIADSDKLLYCENERKSIKAFFFFNSKSEQKRPCIMS